MNLLEMSQVNVYMIFSYILYLGFLLFRVPGSIRLVCSGSIPDLGTPFLHSIGSRDKIPVKAFYKDLFSMDPQGRALVCPSFIWSSDEGGHNSIAVQ